jgi:hypothetical protein
MTRGTLWLILDIVFFGCLWRFSEIFRERPKEKRNESDTCSLAVFLGSGEFESSNLRFLSKISTGGHTTEAMALLESLDFSRYTPRTYILCGGDELSEAKARKFEHGKNPLNEVRLPFFGVLPC